MLVRPEGLVLPPAAEQVYHNVKLDLYENDGMYQDSPAHYLSVGAGALNIIIATLQLAGISRIGSILDFGAGAGRVTRWLRAAFPDAAITVADLRKADIQFCAEKFGAKTWNVGGDLDSLSAPGQFDMIWVGSVLTHLSAENSIELLGKLISWANDRAIVIVTLHGRRALQLGSTGQITYLHDEGWERIELEHRRVGYGYADYENQCGYGISLTKLEWTARLVQSMENVRLLLLSERAWDDHQDVLALQRCQGQIAEAAAVFPSQTSRLINLFSTGVVTWLGVARSPGNRKR